MKLSVKSDYAVRAVLSLSRRFGREESTRVEEIAAENSIPPNYLVQILIDLKSGQIVNSRRGKDGGYRLSREPSQITFAEVVRCIHGPLFDTPALSDDRCPPEIKSVWERLRQAVEAEASAVNFQQLTEANIRRETTFDI